MTELTREQRLNNCIAKVKFWFGKEHANSIFKDDVIVEFVDDFAYIYKI